MNRLIILIGILAITMGCTANQAYIAPPGCDGTDIVSSLPTGTDKATQVLIMVAVVKFPEVRDDVHNGLLIIKETLETRDMTTLQFRGLINIILEDINSDYEMVVAMMTPEITAILSSPGFQAEQLIDPCAKDRLLFWVNSNLTNLSLGG